MTLLHLAKLSLNSEELMNFFFFVVILWFERNTFNIKATITKIVCLTDLSLVLF